VTGRGTAWRQPPIAAVPRKKGAVNTPSEILFFEKESGGFDYSQNRRLASLSDNGRKRPLA